MSHFLYAPVRTDLLHVAAAQLPALNAAAGHTGASAWRATSVELKCVKTVFEEWGRAVFSGRAVRLLEAIDGYGQEMRRLMTHPDERVVKSVLDYFWTGQLLDALDALTPSRDKDRIESFFDVLVTRLDPLLALGAPAWSPLLDTLGIEANDHPDSYRSPIAMRRPDRVDLHTRIASAIGGLAPTDSPITLLQSFSCTEWNLALLMQSSPLSEGDMAYALTQKIASTTDLITHPALTNDGVRFLVMRSILTLSRGGYGSFGKFITAFYARGYSLSLGELMHLKMEYLSSSKPQAHARALSSVRELVADPELSETLFRALTPQGFASLLQPLTSEMWGAAMLAEYTKSLHATRGTHHLRAALDSATADQIRTAPRSLIRALLLSEDKDLRLLATRLVAAWDTTSLTDIAEGQNFLDAHNVSIPTLKRRARPR